MRQEAGVEQLLQGPATGLAEQELVTVGVVDMECGPLQCIGCVFQWVWD